MLIMKSPDGVNRDRQRTRFCLAHKESLEHRKVFETLKRLSNAVLLCTLVFHSWFLVLLSTDCARNWQNRRLAGSFVRKVAKSRLKTPAVPSNMTRFDSQTGVVWSVHDPI
ncbi:MAG: hypothetical protein JWM68_1505 [Verrucomicrobiales bacterium]|nr:hypothetical protein [Verrucomicrobiales bacterium]